MKKTANIRILDLCCKAGGCSVGYAQAAQDLGLQIEIVGVDIEAQPRYPFKFVRGDAVEFLKENWGDFTHIHASPPCQEYSTSTAPMRAAGKEYRDNLTEIRDEMYRTGLPGVIENVMPAPIRRDMVLRGDMFGLRVIRRRKFEFANWFCLAPLMPAKVGSLKGGDYIQVVGNGQLTVTGGERYKGPGGSVREAWGLAMGIDWMTCPEMAEAIPPAYTRYIGQFFFA